MDKGSMVNEIPTVIKLEDYGVVPDSDEDMLPGIKKAIEAAKSLTGSVVLEFVKGTYNIYPEEGIKKSYYITNTASEEENTDVTKLIGLYLKHMDNVTIEGNGALLLYRGKMTQMVIDHCTDIHLNNINFDYKRPTVSEVTVSSTGPMHIDVKVHPDSTYAIEKGKVIWIGEGWNSKGNLSVEYNPTHDKCWRTWNPVTEACKVEEISPNHLRLHYRNRKKTGKATISHSYQLRESIRDQVGIFIHRSKQVTFNDVGMHYSHGLGVVGQYSEDLTFDQVIWEPREETKRTCAAFADFLHLSGCMGKITVRNSRFAGAHDDCINVHGTHLRVVKLLGDNKLKVRFIHGQSYGFDAFVKGDVIEFINAKTLTPYATAHVLDVSRMNPRELILSLDQCPQKVHKEDVIENITCTPDVTIKGNTFGRIPTRGVLLTTRGKIIVENNKFNHTAMSGILIADDAKSWFESGPVSDAVIRNNQFNECESPVIHIAPENTKYSYKEPVHKNITIEGNVFTNKKAVKTILAKSTKGLYIKNNVIQSKTFAVDLLACDNVILLNNQCEDDNGTSVKIRKMPGDRVKIKK